jgi:hypothetical protein
LLGCREWRFLAEIGRLSLRPFSTHRRHIGGEWSP